MWEYLFEEHILERGASYFEEGLVADIVLEEDIVKAKVKGTRDYQVEIEKRGKYIKNLFCSCPYAAKGYNCKHMAALLFALDYKDAPPENKEEKDILELLEEIDPNKLKDFLATILEKDDLLMSKFQSFIKTELSSSDLGGFKGQISKIFYKYTDDYNYIDYNSAWNFFEELEEFVANDIGLLVDNNHLEEAFLLTHYIFQELADIEVDDSAGGIMTLVSYSQELWQQITNQADIGLKRKIFSTSIRELKSKTRDYLEYHIEDFLFDDFKEEEFLIKKADFLDEEIRKEKNKKDSDYDSYRIESLILKRLQVLEEFGTDSQTIEDYCKKNLEFNEVRKYYIEVSIKNQEYSKALELLKEGKKIEKEKKWGSRIASYSVKLKNLYRDLGENQLYKDELWSLVLDYSRGELDLYKELKSLYSTEDWLEKREIIFKELSGHWGIDKFYKYEGLDDRLLDFVLSYPGLDKLYQYESQLKKYYPEELLGKYEDELSDMARYSSDRKKYRNIVDILRKMTSYPDGYRLVNEIIDNWQVRYKNRPAMMDELSKL